jgi:putative transposase
VKYAWLDSQLHSYPVLALCEVLEVSFSGYRSWKRGGTPQRKRLTDIQLLALIRSVHAEVKGAYGSPRMTINWLRVFRDGRICLPATPRLGF